MTDVQDSSIISNNGSSKKANTATDSSQTIEIYKQALTFNVIAKYDPSIAQLLHISSYCVIYQYDEDAEDWVKSSYMGPVSVYARRSIWDKVGDDKSIKKVSVDQILAAKQGEYYRFGLLVLNRGQPENFSLGFLGDKYIQGDDVKDDRGLLVEKSDQLIIVRDFNGNAFGLWIFDEKDRDYLYQLLMYCTDQLV